MRFPGAARPPGLLRFGAVLLMWAAPASAQVGGVEAVPRDARCDDVEAAVDSLRAAYGIPGLAAAVVTARGESCSVATGLADVESGTPVTAATRFRIRSVSKLLTAHMAARLAAEGRLDLDAPVREYVPALPAGSPAADEGVTVRRLAAHTAGVRHYSLPESVLPSTTRYSTGTETLGIFAADPLRFAPGTEYFYSSYGYNLIGAAIEGITGKPFPEAVRELVSEPLGLTGLAPDTVPPGPDRATDYERPRSGPPHRATPDDLTNRLPSGGYVASAEELARFALAHLDDGRMPGAMRDILWSPARLVSGEEVEAWEGTVVGLGWRMERDAAGRRVLHHGGAGRGGRAHVQLYPDHGVAVAFAGNLQVAGLGPGEAGRLAAAYLGFR